MHDLKHQWSENKIIHLFLDSTDISLSFLSAVRVEQMMP